MEALVHWFSQNLSQYISPEGAVFLISMIPLLELRGGLLAASLLKISAAKAIPLCIVGNIIPIPFILLFIKQIFKVLKKHPYTRGILHCFPGNAAEARQAIDMGYLLGIGGVVTFKKSQMADTLREIGPANIVLETDSPYLTPVPFRGKRNESSYIPLIAQKIAELTGLETKKIEEITTQNALNLFNLQCENV